MSSKLIAPCKIFEKEEEYHTVHTDEGEIVVPKFDGDNYEEWASKVKKALEDIGAWEIVTGELKDPGKSASVVERMTYNALNIKGNELICETLTENILECLDDLKKINGTGCRETWNLLQFTFSDAGAETMFREDIQEDVREVNHFKESDVEKWVEQRKKTIEIVQKWCEWLETLANGAKKGEVLCSITSLCGNAIDICGLLFPQLSAMRKLMLIARWARIGGTGGTCALKLVEGISSEAFLLKVRNALKEDAEKSAKLRDTFQSMARVDTSLQSDFGVSLWQYVWFRVKCRGNPSLRVAAKNRIFNGETSKHLSLGFLRFMGHYTGKLNSVQNNSLWVFGGKTGVFMLSAAEISLDLFNLFVRLREDDCPAYVKAVKTELEKLNDELEKISTTLKGDPPSRT